MASKTIEIQLKTMLDEYDENVQDLVDEIGKQVAKESAKQLQATSPRKTGEYANGWKSRKTPYGYVVYNASKPRLTHLLEKGHLIRNKYGTFGRAPKFVHIKPVEEWANKEFQSRIEKGLNNL